MKRTMLIVLSLLLSLALLPNAGAQVAPQTVYILDQDTGIQLPNAAAWTESDFFPQAYGPDYSFDRRDGSAGGPTLTIRTPGNLDSAGPTGGGSAWEVYGRWAPGPGRCSNVRIEVRRNNGASLVLTTTRDMRPTTEGFNWVRLGSFTAVANQNYEVRYYANNTIVGGDPSTGIGCVVSPDGAMFVKRTFDGSDVFNLDNFDILDEAGLDFDLSVGTVTITSSISTSPTLLQGPVSITCPRSGYIHAMGSGGYSALYGSSTSTTLVPYIWYSVSTTTGMDFNNATIHGQKQGTSSINNRLLGYSSVAVDRVDTCSSGQTFTYRFNAYRVNAGTASFIRNPKLVVKYYSTIY